MNTNAYSNAETVRKMYEAMSNKEGKENLEIIYTNLLAGYGELNYTHIDIEPIADANKVLVRWGVDIELKGKEKHYTNELIGVFEFENGKVKAFTEYFIPLRFADAIK